MARQKEASKSQQRGKSIMEILFVLYAFLGYLAVPRTIWANKILIGSNLFKQRAILGIFLGWILIPWWILKIFLGSK